MTESRAALGKSHCGVFQTEHAHASAPPRCGACPLRRHRERTSSIHVSSGQSLWPWQGSGLSPGQHPPAGQHSPASLGQHGASGWPSGGAVSVALLPVLRHSVRTV